MKVCFKCGREKKLSEFYVHIEMADGHLNKCKECAKKDVTEHRNKNIDRIREYDRERGKLPHRKNLCAKLQKIRRKRNPLQYAAETILNNAVRGKKIKEKKRCEECGCEGKLNGHHEDYYKPSEVVWLCYSCHFARHKEINKRHKEINNERRGQ